MTDMAVYYSERDGEGSRNWIVEDSFLGIVARKKTKKTAVKYGEGEAQSRANHTDRRVVVEVYSKSDKLSDTLEVEPKT